MTEILVNNTTPNYNINDALADQNPVVEKMYDDFVIDWSKPIMNGLAPSPRGGHSAVLADNQMIVFGGHYFGGKNKFTYLNETFVLDLETSTWHDVKCGGYLPQARYDHSATLVGSKMYVFGGRGENGAVLKDMHFLNLENWCWYPVKWTTDAPHGRYNHGHVAVGTKIVFHGGWDGKKSFHDLWVFDTDSFTWMKPKTLNNPPTPRHGHTLSLVEDGRILVFGGYCVSSGSPPKYNGDLYSLDTETMEWSRPRVCGEFPPARFGHNMIIDDNRVYLIGGWSGTQRQAIHMGNKFYREELRSQRREEHLRSGKISQANTQPLKDVTGTSKYFHILNTESMQWETPPSRGIQVANRYGQSCVLVGPHIFLFGGWDGNRALNELIVGRIPV